MNIPFDNTYAQLPERFFARQQPARVPEPKLVRLNLGLAAKLSMDTDWLTSTDGLAMLAGNAMPDHAIARHYSDAVEASNAYVALLESVAAAQADLIAQWMSLGFIHGVMNTDNTAISGETIDYGPCAFMDAFHPRCVYSSIDSRGRYAWGSQPDVGLWNVTRFAETLLPLLSDDQSEASRIAEAALSGYPERFRSQYAARFRAKLGLPPEAPVERIQECLDLLGAHEVDFTLFFRHLTRVAGGEDPQTLAAMFSSSEPFEEWFAKWRREADPANVVFDRTLAVRDTSLRQEFVRAAGSHVVEAGAELHRLSTGLSFQIRGDRKPTATNGSSVQGGAGLPDLLISNRDVTRVGLWLLDRWQATSAVSLEGGLRVDRSGMNSDTQVSPRVTAVFTLNPTTRLRGALGRYTQSPGYEKQVQSDYVLDLTGTEARGLRSEQAIQASTGLERDLGQTGMVRVEGYYKRFHDLLIGRLEPEVERLARVGRYDFPLALADSVPADPIITTVPTNDGRGRGYGFDLFVSRQTAPADARVRGWASYTWGRAEREAYGQRYPFEYDRRHAFSAVASYRLSNRWEIASTTRIASGFPRTPPIGLRMAGADDSDDRDRDDITDELLPAVDSAGRPVYAVDFGGVSNLNAGRLPMFARMDVRATWRPRGQAGRWELYAEVINVLNRKNAGAFEPELEYDPASDRPRIVEKRDQAIPRLPTIGVRVRF